MARKQRTKKPKHKWETRAYHVLLHPTEAQQEQMWHTVFGCWFLRAQFVNDREKNRKQNRELKQNGTTAVHYLSRADQYQAIPSYVAKFPDELKGIHSQVLQNVAERIDQGTQRWHEARKKGKYTVHPPHHIRCRKYRSFTYPQYGSAVNLHHGYMYLSGIGLVKADCWRKIRGKPKSVTVKFWHGQWWAIISCDIQAKDIYRPKNEVNDLPDGAGDPGLESLLTDTEGEKYNPRKAWHEARKRLAHEMRDMSRKFRARENHWKEDYIEWIAQGVKPPESLREVPYSKRLLEQIKRVAKLHARVFNIRDNDHKKLASRLEDTFRLFGIEDHGLLFMLRNRRQAKLAQDRAIGKMKHAVKSKLGPRYYEYPNRIKDGRGNSQVCVCGADVPKELGDRVHDCPVCKLKAERDFVSANVGMQNKLGYVSVRMKQLQEAAGLAASGRGGGEVVAGESRGGELQSSPAAALESPQPAGRPKKRQPLAEPEDRSTTDGEPAVGGKKAGIRRGGATRRSLSRRAPKPGQCGQQQRPTGEPPG